MASRLIFPGDAKGGLKLAGFEGQKLLCEEIMALESAEESAVQHKKINGNWFVCIRGEGFPDLDHLDHFLPF